MRLQYKLFLFGLSVALVFFARFSIADALPAPGVVISSDHLAQADTLLVAVKNETVKPAGTLGNVKLRFFQSQNQQDWIALVGMPVSKKPGDYLLTVTVAGKAPFQKTITVAAREFPVTELVLTPQLLQEGYTAKKIIKNITTKENVRLEKVLSVIHKKSYIAKPFIDPLKEIKIVGPFGDIRATKKYKIQHLGVDLAAPIGTPVLAVNDGKVVFEKSLPDYGNTLVIDHGLGLYSLYLHLKTFNVKTGAAVKQGDTVALSGNTGYVTGPHLHFSIKMRGAALDPLKFIQTTQTTW